MRLLRDWQRVVCPLLSLALPALAQSHAQGETASATITTTDTTITTPARLAPDATVKPVAGAGAQSTCEARTVNYITHTLPQQCLTATPSPAAPTHASASASGPSPSHGSAAEQAVASPPDPPRAPPSPADDDEHELDSDGNDLSTGAFMSFEQWKKKMLQKAGQEPLEARARKPHGEYPGGDLSSLGDEGEISLDFGAYSDRISDIASPGKPAPREQEKPDAAEKVHYDEGLANVYRSKDAGKTCKERFSYASFDAGATILKTSPGAKNTKAILVENKDSYMLLECASPNKFFIVELSEDIVVDTVVLANFEFFSSMIRHFRVSVSDRYPAKLDKWKVLGEFQARNSRDIQPFLIENPQIWARYLRIEILSHYGNEFYCPVSLLRVHGTRMLDSWKDHDPTDLELEEEELARTLPEQPEEIEAAPEVAAAEEVEVVEPDQDNVTISMERVSPNPPCADLTFFEHYFQTKPTCPSGDAPAASTSTSEATAVEAGDVPARPRVTTEKSNGFVDSIRSLTSALKPSEETPTADAMAPKPTTPTPKTSSLTPADDTTEASVTSTSSVPANGTQMRASSSPSSSSTKFTTPLSIKPSSNPPARSKSSSSGAAKSSSSKAPQPKQPAVSSSSSRNRNATATTSSPSSSPTVQDSFFKQLTKRLQTLESNTTLSLQYIESQSKFLQEALSKLERRQVAKVDLFLDTLNKTVFSELRDLRVQYDQMWQSTVIALETHRDQSEREILAVSSRLGALADEVVFQKRMVIVQSVLLLGCLLVLVFSGRLAGSGVELYYPSHILGASSRLGSPVYPSTPKTTARIRPDRSLASGLRESIEVDPGLDSSPPNPNSNLMPMNGGDRRRAERSATPEPESVRTPQHQQAPLHPAKGQRPPSQRAVSESGGLKAYYQPPTPASLEAGYDSEPALTPNREYFPRSDSQQQRPSSSSSSSPGLNRYEEPRPASSSSSASSSYQQPQTQPQSPPPPPPPLQPQVLQQQQPSQRVEPYPDGQAPGVSKTAEEGVAAALADMDGANGTRRLVEADKAEGATAGVPDMASYRAARPPLSHAGSLRKEPLPALPEDDDRGESG